MTMQSVRLTKPVDIFQLPQGRLVFSEVEVGFSRELALESAEKLLEHDDVDGLDTQAQAIERAGRRYGLSRKTTCRAIGGCDESDQDLPEGKVSMVKLRTPEDALRLVPGTLALPPFTISFEEAEVLEAAQYLIERKDIENFVSQAGVIARAGLHGYGKGDQYRTI